MMIMHHTMIQIIKNMKKILKYNMFNESVKNENQIIIDIIIPFCIKKYYDLSEWANKKVHKECAPLQGLKFEKFENKWKLILVATGWSINDANILIRHILSKSIKEESLKNDINLTEVSYAAASAISDFAIKYIDYDVINKKVLEQK